MKSFKPAERHALPNQVVQAVANITIYNDAANDPGAFGYLRLLPRIRRFSRVVGIGRYIGHANKVSAFVWSEYPNPKAA